ncbi:MAG: hypothetical protein KC635_30060, partial [Myxococcales bacterium]|nr:hypothetical protein [Myxococcales bacterium]
MSEAAPLRPAATLVLLDGPEDAPRTLLLKRAAQSPFMANAWVFPGGRVDDADHAPAAAPGFPPELAQIMLQRSMGFGEEAEARAHLVCALRETFEEAGVLLGATDATDAVVDAARRRLLAGETTWDAVLVELGASLAWDELIYGDHWVTPPVERRRYDTRFYLARVGGRGAAAMHDAHETTESAWLSAEEALARHATGELGLAPPTFWLLTRFAELGTIDGILTWAAARDVIPMAPAVLPLKGGGVSIVLPGDHEHPT